jgi:hypothetical protein
MHNIVPMLFSMITYYVDFEVLHIKCQEYQWCALLFNILLVCVLQLLESAFEGVDWHDLKFVGDEKDDAESTYRYVLTLVCLQIVSVYRCAYVSLCLCIYVSMYL